MIYIKFIYKLLKKLLLKLLVILVKPIYNIGFKWKLITPKIIVNIDGGICSQMHQYLIGEIFRRKGYITEYSLLFYRKRKQEIISNNIRNFDLLKAFPNLNFTSVSKWNDFLYRNCYFHLGKYPNSHDVSWVNLSAPVFLGGYYYDPKDMYKEIFQEIFKVSTQIMNASDKEVYKNIPKASIAVHVRRGDLSVYHEAYGEPVTIEYFKKAISYFKALLTNPVFYFFSDDLEYVKIELLPSLSENISFILLDNGTDKGYIDLFLISRCTHQITSKGALGKFGALLNMIPERKIVAFKDDPQLFYFNEYTDHLVLMS